MELSGPSNVTNNHGDREGGAFYISSSGILALKGIDFKGNEARYDGKDVYM
jgi:hypothetical protein